MSKEDKEIEEKVSKFLAFVKKECPECYQKMKQCCADAKSGNKE